MSDLTTPVYTDYISDITEGSTDNNIIDVDTYIIDNTTPCKPLRNTVSTPRVPLTRLSINTINNNPNSTTVNNNNNMNSSTIKQFVPSNPAIYIPDTPSDALQLIENHQFIFNNITTSNKKNLIQKLSTPMDLYNNNVLMNNDDNNNGIHNHSDCSQHIDQLTKQNNHLCELNTRYYTQISAMTNEINALKQQLYAAINTMTQYKQQGNDNEPVSNVQHNISNDSFNSTLQSIDIVHTTQQAIKSNKTAKFKNWLKSTTENLLDFVDVLGSEINNKIDNQSINRKQSIISDTTNNISIPSPVQPIINKQSIVIDINNHSVRTLD